MADPVDSRMRVKLSTRMDDPGSNSKVTVENAPTFALQSRRRAGQGPRQTLQQRRPASHNGQGHQSTPIYLLAASQDDVREAAIRIFNATKSRAQHETIGKERFGDLCRCLWLVAEHGRRTVSVGDQQQDQTIQDPSSFSTQCSQNTINGEWLGATMGNTQPLAHRRFLLWFVDTVWRWGLEGAPGISGLSPSDQVRKLIEFTQSLTPRLLSANSLGLRSEAVIRRSFHENSFSHFDTLAPVSSVRRAVSANSLRLNPRKTLPRERSDASPQTKIHVTSLELKTGDCEPTGSSPNRFIQHLLNTQNETRMHRIPQLLDPLEHSPDALTKDGIVLSRPTTSSSIQNLHPGRPELSRQQSQNLEILNRRKLSLSESISVFPVTPWVDNESSYGSHEDVFRQIDKNIGTTVDGLIAHKLSRPELTVKKSASVVEFKLDESIQKAEEKTKKKKKRKKKRSQAEPDAKSNTDYLKAVVGENAIGGSQIHSIPNHSCRPARVSHERVTSKVPLHRVTVDTSGLAPHAHRTRGEVYGGQFKSIDKSKGARAPYVSQMTNRRSRGPGLIFIDNTRGLDGKTPSFDPKVKPNIDWRLHGPHYVPLAVPSLTDDPREVVYQRERQVLIDHRLEHENKMLMITGGGALTRQRDLTLVGDSIDTAESAILDINASITSHYGDKDRLRCLPTRQLRKYQTERERALSEALGRDKREGEGSGVSSGSSLLDRKEGNLLQNINKLEEQARLVLGPQDYADLRLRLPKPENSNIFGDPSVAELLTSEPQHFNTNKLSHAARLLRIANTSERKMSVLQRNNLQLRSRMLQLVGEGPFKTASLYSQQQLDKRRSQVKQRPTFEANDHAFLNSGRAYALHNPQLPEDSAAVSLGKYWSLQGAPKKFSPPRKLRTAGSSERK